MLGFNWHVNTAITQSLLDKVVKLCFACREPSLPLKGESLFRDFEYFIEILLFSLKLKHNAYITFTHPPIRKSLMFDM